MFNLNTIIILVLSTSIMGVVYLHSQVKNLENEVSVVQEQAKNNLNALNDLSKSVDKLQITYADRDKARAVRDKSDTKMRNDAERIKPVIEKPGLVEKKINDSFNSFAQGLQEATK